MINDRLRIYNILDLLEGQFRLERNDSRIARSEYPSDYFHWNYYLDASTTNTGIVLELVKEENSLIPETLIISSLPFHKFDSRVKRSIELSELSQSIESSGNSPNQNSIKSSDKSSNKSSDNSTFSDTEDAFVLKMRYVRDMLQKLILTFPPNHIYIEGGFVQPKFLHSSSITLKFHGFLVAELMDYGITYIPPKKVKKIVTGNGNAKKEDVQRKLQEMYEGSVRRGILVKNYDESDALALWECVREGRMN